MTQEPTPELSSEQIEKGLSKMIKQGVTVQVRTSLTESVFLVGFALLLQAPNTVIGILAAIPAVAQFLQVPAIILVEKIHNRRRLNFFSTGIQKSWLGATFRRPIQFFYLSTLKESTFRNC